MRRKHHIKYTYHGMARFLLFKHTRTHIHTNRHTHTSYMFGGLLMRTKYCCWINIILWSCCNKRGTGGYRGDWIHQCRRGRGANKEMMQDGLKQSKGRKATTKLIKNTRDQDLVRH